MMTVTVREEIFTLHTRTYISRNGRLTGLLFTCLNLPVYPLCADKSPHEERFKFSIWRSSFNIFFKRRSLRLFFHTKKTDKEVNMKKKILTAFMALCLILTGLFSAIPAYAANENVILVWTKLGSSYNCTHISYNYPTTYPNADIRVYKVDGRIAFCIQSAKAIRDKNGKSMMDYGDNDEMTQSVGVKTASTDNSLQSKVAYLGYYNNSHTNKNYAFTQMMIWQTLPNEDLTANGKNPEGSGFLTYFNNSDTRSEYNTWKKNIQAKIDEWYTRPSFNASTQTIKGGTSTTLTDSRGVFEDYNAFTYTKDGITISHSKGSNTLTVTAAGNCTKKSVRMSDDEIASVGGTKYSSTYDTAYTYTEDDTQNMATYGPVDPVPLRINFNVQIVSGKVQINKSKAPDASSDRVLPEQGAEFEIYLKSSGSYAASDDEHRDRITTAADGKATSKLLPWGVYTVHQTEAPAGHVKTADFDVNITNTDDGKIYTYNIRNETVKANIKIVKKDAETGKTVPLAGTEYEIINLTTGEKINSAAENGNFVTDATGQITLPEPLYYGRYRVNEIHAPYGYVLGESVEFEVTGTESSVPTITVEQKNAAQKGVINIEKHGEILKSVEHDEESDDYHFKFGESGIAGAVFEIRAADDIVTPDGTVRFHAGDLVDTVTTVADGKAQSKPQYLGRYIITEVKAPEGFLLDESEHEAELTYAGETVAVTSTMVSLNNERQKAHISLKKLLEEDELFERYSDDSAGDVEFSLFAAEEITAEDGTSAPPDGRIETVGIKSSMEGDADYETSFNADLPFGKFYVKETKTNVQYVEDAAEHDLDFSYQGQDVPVVELEANDGEPIFNRLLRGRIQGLKLGDKDAPQAGAIYGLFNTDTEKIGEDTALMTSVSDEEGKFEFDDVPYGYYDIREIKAPRGHLLDMTPHRVFISEDAQVIELTAQNAPKIGYMMFVTHGGEMEERVYTGIVPVPETDDILFPSSQKFLALALLMLVLSILSAKKAYRRGKKKE